MQVATRRRPAMAGAAQVSMAVMANALEVGSREREWKGGVGGESKKIKKNI